MYKKYLKRIIDFILSLGGIICLCIPMAIVAVAIKLDSKGPVLFKQKRVGMGKTHFQIWKFRTMRTDTPKDAPTHELSDPDKWITRTGRILRKTSLDELPQLFNILAGHMSVIGPRPALWNQYDLIEERDKYGANDVRPGLTGLAQINGGYTLLPEEKRILDMEYIENRSFWGDIKLIFSTVKLIFTHEGAR